MNTYSNTISELYKLQQFSIKMGLDNITKICDFLDNPQNSYPVIHVAGTNGKGSTSRMIQSILSLHGLKVGLYTSPHLVDFRERITVNEEQIDKDFVVEYWQKISSLVNKLRATFFDTTTALAFMYFRKNNIDVAIIETGLGGRLDSTNIVKPLSVVITPIEIDHTKQLGSRLKSIALEKASIIKNGSTVFVAKQKKNVRDVLIHASSRAKTCYYFTDTIRIDEICSGQDDLTFRLFDRLRKKTIEHIRVNLAGYYQAGNAGLAYLCSRWFLENSSMVFSEKLIKKALGEITWPGRLQIVSQSPLVYFDVSHNYAGFKHTLEFVDKLSCSGEKYLLFGLLEDKAYKPIIRMIHESFRNVIITEPAHDRALSAQLILKEFKKYGMEAIICKSITEAYAKTIQNMAKNDVLFVMGSHYIIGELLAFSGKNT